MISFCFLTAGSWAQIDHSEVSTVKRVLQENSISVDKPYITDHYTSQGITHTYFKESINGIPVYNSRGAIHYKVPSEIILNHAFMRKLKNVNVPFIPALSAKQTLDRLATTKGFDKSGEVIGAYCALPLALSTFRNH